MSVMRWVLAVSLALTIPACQLGSRDDDDDDDDTDLTPLEWSMVGVWRGSRPDDRWEYYVFDTDRTGCTWIREGDDFTHRYEEVQFRDWSLDANALDEDFHVPLRFVGVSNREVYDSDEYDTLGDRILPSGQTNIAATWTDIRIPCDGVGSESTESGVQRWGSMGNGYTGTGDPDDPGSNPTGPGTGNPGTTTPGTTPTGPTVPSPVDTGPDTADTGVPTGPTGPQPP